MGFDTGHMQGITDSEDFNAVLTLTDSTVDISVLHISISSLSVVDHSIKMNERKQQIKQRESTKLCNARTVPVVELYIIYEGL